MSPDLGVGQVDDARMSPKFDFRAAGKAKMTPKFDARGGRKGKTTPQIRCSGWSEGENDPPNLNWWLNAHPKIDFFINEFSFGSSFEGGNLFDDLDFLRRISVRKTVWETGIW